MDIEVPISAEQSPALKGVEVKATPIPQFDGQNASDVTSAFISNVNIVSGGSVMGADGRVIKTDGLFGAKKMEIDARLSLIETGRSEVNLGRDQYGRNILLQARAVREASAESRSVTRSNAKNIDIVKKSLQKGEGEFAKYCDDKKIDSVMQDKWDQLVEVEKHLVGTAPGVEQISNDQEYNAALQYLHWEGLPEERIRDRFEGFAFNTPAYKHYRNLRLGLRTLNVMYEEVKVASQQTKEAADAKLAEAKQNTQEWERKNADVRDQNKEAESLKRSRAVISEVEEFLTRDPDKQGYIPDAAKLADIGDQIDEKNEAIRVGTEAIAVLRRIGGTGVETQIKSTEEKIMGAARRKIAELRAESTKLSDPIARLTQAKTPKALAAMVKLVNKPGFDIDKVPANQRVLAEATMILQGKGSVQVTESVSVEQVLEEAQAAGPVPVVEGPGESEAAEAMISEGSPVFSEDIERQAVLERYKQEAAKRGLLPLEQGHWMNIDGLEYRTMWGEIVRIPDRYDPSEVEKRVSRIGMSNANDGKITVVAADGSMYIGLINDENVAALEAANYQRDSSLPTEFSEGTFPTDPEVRRQYEALLEGRKIVPEAQAEPEPAQIDLATASVEEISKVANTLTAEQIAQIPFVNRALLAFDGAFTPYQLRSLSSDPEAAQTNGDFIDKYYDTLKRYIESSANIHDVDSSRGISRIEGMPRLILNALRQVAGVEYNRQPILDIERTMSAENMRESIGRLTNASIPSPLREDAIRAVKLLELADYAREAMLKGLK